MNPPAGTAVQGEAVQDEAAQGDQAPGTNPAVPPPARVYSLQSLLILLVLATALPLILLLAYSAWRANEAETARANQLVMSLADITVADTAATVDQLHRLAALLAGSPALRSLDRERCDPRAEELMRLQPGLVNIATIDLKGSGVCSVLTTPGGARPGIGEPPWYRELKQRNDFVVSKPMPGLFTGRWVVLLAHPLRDAAGSVAGAVILVVDLASFQPVVSATLAEGSAVGIIDGAGNVIARVPRGADFVGKNLAGTTLVRQVLEQRKGSMVGTGVEGVERFTSFRPIPGADWYVVAGVPTGEIYAMARRNTWRAIALSLAVLAGAALLVLEIQRRIARPMQALTATARRVAAGEFGERAAGDGPREVAEVAAGFNYMLDRIPQMQSELDASEARYRQLVDAAPEAMVVQRHGRILMVNEAAVRLYGVASPDELMGRDAFSLVHPDDRAAALARKRDVLNNNVPPRSLERRHLRADGTVLEVEVLAVRLDFQDDPAVLVMAHDISARKAAERRVARLSNLYAALSRTNEAIFRETDPLVLCHAVCEIAVTHGHLLSASIRLYDPVDRMLKPYCGYGPLEGWIGARPIDIDDPHSRAAWSAREKRRFVSNDLLGDAEITMAHADAERLGVRASSGFPLIIAGETAGVFCVYSAEVNFFDAELADLLDEMARNLSFAFAKLRGEAALQTSETHYRMLFDASPDAICVIQDNRMVMFNPAGVRLLGLSSGHGMLNQPLTRVVAPEMRDMALERIRVVTEERHALPPIEQTLLRPDGTRLVVEAVALPIEYQGRPAALSIIRDLTARKAAEKRVHRLTQLYAALSHTNEAIFREKDPLALCRQVCAIAVTHGGLLAAAIRRVDAASAMLIPYCHHGPCAGMVGIAPIALADANSNVARVAREGGHYFSNDIDADPAVISSRADRERVGVRAAAGFALSVDGQVWGVLTVYAGEIGFFDPEFTGLLAEMAGNLSYAFSKQRSAAALVASEERYRALFDASPDAIRVICEDRVVMLNPAGVRLFGLSSSEGMVGKLVYDTIDPEFREVAMERIRTVIGERRAVPLSEQALVRADGTRIDVEVVTMPFEYEGKPAALSIVHDLTARKAVERATLRLNAELEDRVQRRTAALKRANEDLEAFSYTVAHDLRAPLRRMNGFATLLKDSMEGRLSDDARSFLGRIVEAGSTMDRLIEGMLELARLGRTELKPENLDLSELARSVAAELYERDPQRDIEWVMQDGVMVRADPRLIRGVLENLLGNAWKFTSGHKTARIEFGALPPAALSATAPLDERGIPVAMDLRVCYVRDDGAGFDARYSDKLFGNFQRLHDAGQFPGTGVGLASAKRIIVNHGGRVWAEGAVEQGATFYFTLPAIQ